MHHNKFRRPMSGWGHDRSFVDVGSMSGLIPKAAVQRTTVDSREVPLALIAAIRRTDVTEYLTDSSGSLQFDPRKLDHLGPFLSIRGYEFSELVGRHRH